MDFTASDWEIYCDWAAERDMDPTLSETEDAFAAYIEERQEARAGV